MTVQKNAIPVETALLNYPTNINDTNDLSSWQELTDFWSSAKPSNFDKNVKRLKTGIEELDEELGGGFRKGGTFGYGAVPGLGKTQLALKLTKSFIEQGENVAYLTYEMVPIKLAHRFYGFIMNDLKIDEDMAQETILKEYAPHLDLNPQYGSDSNLGVIISTSPASVIFIDYLQLVQSISTNNLIAKDRIDVILKDIVSASRKTGKTVFFISSISRTSYDSVHTLGSFKESGAIEYSADVLITFNKPTNKPDEIEFKVIKNRDDDKTDKVRLFNKKIINQGTGI